MTQILDLLFSFKLGILQLLLKSGCVDPTLRLIFLNLPHVGRSPTTSCLVQKRGCLLKYGIVQPILYATIIQTHETPDVLPYLLRTILEKPDLARLIKRFDGESLALYENLDMSILTDEHFRQIQSTCMKDDVYGKDDCTMWMDELKFGTKGITKSGNYDAAFAVVLILLSDKLEVVKLVYQQPSYYWTNIVLAQMAKLQQNQSMDGFLWNLRHVHITSPETKWTDHLTFAAMVPYLKLNSLRKMTADGIDGAGKPNLHSKYGKSFHVPDLDIRGWFDTATMRSILKCFNCLKNLRCYQYADAFGNAPLYSSAFTHGLAHFENSLETFEFENNASVQRYDDAENSWIDDESEIDLDAFYGEPIKSCDMEKYKRLKVYKFSAYLDEEPKNYKYYISFPEAWHWKLMQLFFLAGNSGR